MSIKACQREPDSSIMKTCAPLIKQRGIAATSPQKGKWPPNTKNGREDLTTDRTDGTDENKE
jgi:hypothetical protein